MLWLNVARSGQFQVCTRYGRIVARFDTEADADAYIRENGMRGQVPQQPKRPQPTANQRKVMERLAQPGGAVWPGVGAWAEACRKRGWIAVEPLGDCYRLTLTDAGREALASPPSQ